MKRLIAWLRAVRWPLLCTRCGSLSHYVEDCTRMPPCMGMTPHEREMVDNARRSRNCGLGIIATVMAGYFALLWIGGPV